jgi:hypothetical protein
MHGPGASHLHGWINHALLPSPPSFALHDRINYTSAQLNRLARFYRTLLTSLSLIFVLPSPPIKNTKLNTLPVLKASRGRK